MEDVMKTNEKCIDATAHNFVVAINNTAGICVGTLCSRCGGETYWNIPANDSKPKSVSKAA